MSDKQIKLLLETQLRLEQRLTRLEREAFALREGVGALLDHLKTPIPNNLPAEIWLDSIAQSPALPRPKPDAGA